MRNLNMNCLLCCVFLAHILLIYDGVQAVDPNLVDRYSPHYSEKNNRFLKKSKARLVAITSANSCASSRGGDPLPYGPRNLDGLKWDKKSPYFCTDCVSGRSRNWKQVFQDETGVLLTMFWKFSNYKSLEDRFNHAALRSENVTWTMKEPSKAAVTLSGRWWWSTDGREFGSEGRTYPTKVSGPDFSQENGCWAAGANVNGGDDSNFQNGPFDIQWGQCDSVPAGHPFCGQLYRNGSQKFIPTLKSKLYVLDCRK